MTTKKTGKWFETNAMKAGFAVGTGVILSNILFTVFGLLFFIYGYQQYKDENKTFGIVCMLIGMALLHGHGLDTFISEVFK